MFFISRKPTGFSIETDRFEISTDTKRAWAQDYFGVVKDTLLEFENTDKSQLLKKIFNFRTNPVQKQIREEMNYPQVQEYVDLLYNIPISKVNGKEGILIDLPEGPQFIDKAIYDAEFNLNSQILKNIISNTHIKGGNYYITQGSGKREILIGQNELKKFSIEQMKEMFQADSIHVIPQADYHLDLFLRPLKGIIFESCNRHFVTISTAVGKNRTNEIILYECSHKAALATVLVHTNFAKCLMRSVVRNKCSRHKFPTVFHVNNREISTYN